MIWISLSFSSTYEECINLEITIWFLVEKEAPERTEVETEIEKIFFF